MSVLIEAVALVVPRQALDVSYPGGSAGFLARMRWRESGARHVCADDALVAASFHDASEAAPIVEELADLGLVSVDDGACVEMALVDQRTGPAAPCLWLALRRDPAGYTCAWLAGREEGALAHPDGWTAEQSRELVRTSSADDPNRAMRLSEDDGVETWLDFATGQLHESPAERRELPLTTAEGEVVPDPSPAAPSTRPPDEQSLGDVVRRAFDARPFDYRVVEQGHLLTRFWGTRGAYDCHVLWSDALRQVVAFCAYSVRVPEPRRPAVAESAVRASCGTWFGGFDLDFGDGELRCRTALDVEGGALSTAMVDNLVNVAFRMCERYHDAFMRVIWAGAEPADAIREAEAA